MVSGEVIQKTLSKEPTNDCLVIDVVQPGEDLPEGTTFIDAFGLVFDESTIRNVRSAIDRINENERRAAIVSRRIIVN